MQVNPVTFPAVLETYHCGLHPRQGFHPYTPPTYHLHIHAMAEHSVQSQGASGWTLAHLLRYEDVGADMP